MWCIPEVSAEYVAAMEDVLDLYEEAYDETRPMVCFDESPQQLIAEVREPIPAAPGRTECFDEWIEGCWGCAGIGGRSPSHRDFRWS